jgi:hypothetical protein
MGIVGFIGILRKYQDTLPGYLIAALVFVVALGLREAVDPYIKIPYVTLFPAMIICSLVGGRAAGILAAVVSAELFRQLQHRTANNRRLSVERIRRSRCDQNMRPAGSGRAADRMIAHVAHRCAVQGSKTLLKGNLTRLTE